jgi:hypothetical protein
MARLPGPRRKGLTLNDFQMYPVWVWDDANENHLPVSDPEKCLGEYCPAFVRADFEASGQLFDGYLVGSSTFHAFCLFLLGRKFVFNLNLPDDMRLKEAEISALLKRPSFKLFPLHYSSSMCVEGGFPIKGTFSIQ